MRKFSLSREPAGAWRGIGGRSQTQTASYDPLRRGKGHVLIAAHALDHVGKDGYVDWFGNVTIHPRLQALLADADHRMCRHSDNGDPLGRLPLLRGFELGSANPRCRLESVQLRR